VHVGDWRRRTAFVAAALFSTASLLDVPRNWWWCLALLALWATVVGLLNKNRPDSSR
jgi:hypothetical protein